MRQSAVSLVLAVSICSIPAVGQVPTPEMNQILSDAAQSLAAMPFDQNASVTVRGHVAILVWPEGSSGMVIIEASQGGEKYAFSTAGVPTMAKQGFTRFSLRP